MYTLDLHTHSKASRDGGLSMHDYRTMIQSAGLDYIAITDHNRIDFALMAQSEFPNAIIVGEEISTAQGDLIGLYLTTPIAPGKSILETAQLIRSQGGLVYVPHPFETARKGVSLENIEHIAHLVDIVETYNGRALFQNRRQQAEDWARSHGKPGVASSDAHGWNGWGETYTTIELSPHPETLPEVLQAAKLRKVPVGFVGSLYPKFNRLRKVLHV